MGREVNELYIQYIDLSGPTQCKTCRTRFVKNKETGAIECPSCRNSFRDAHTGVVKYPIPLWPEEHALEFITTRRDILKKALFDLIPPPPEKDWLCNYCHHVEVCERS